MMGSLEYQVGLSRVVCLGLRELLVLSRGAVALGPDKIGTDRLDKRRWESFRTNIIFNKSHGQIDGLLVSEFNAVINSSCSEPIID